jgi:hypothetical protein
MQEKATPIRPPMPESATVEVNMTAYVATTAALSVATAGLTAATVFLWRKTKRNTELLEAMGDYVAKLVNETDCGSTAYKLLVDGVREEDVVDFSEDHAPYPTKTDEPQA